MRHQRVERWESRLNELLRQVDHALEEEYGHLFALHPARPLKGSTANPQHDGLFRITASFSPGFGSELGRGYVLQLDLVTLERVPQVEVERIQRKAVRLIQDGLERVLPGRGLTVQRDGNVWKIVGDLSLKSIHVKH
ncbi:MAG TPA: hypothetical protein P5026_09030 [Kiritimatiellia bacterium]|nr:hypothetical protein [Kiritimatiellia bacterium]